MFRCQIWAGSQVKSHSISLSTPKKKKKKSNREVPQKKMSTKQDHPCSAGAVSSPESPHRQRVYICQIAQWCVSFRADTCGDIICGKTNELLMTISVPLAGLEKSLGVLAAHWEPVSCSLSLLRGERCRGEPVNKCSNPPNQTQHYTDGNQH